MTRVQRARACRPWPIRLVLATLVAAPFGALLSMADLGLSPLPFSMRPAEAQQRGFVSPQVAFDQGLAAFKNGYFEIAVPALEHAAAKGDETIRFFAEFYLAQIFGDTTSPQYDQAKAYIFYHRIAEENADIDPDDTRRAPYVARALTALASLVRQGVPEAGLRPDVERALEYYHHAATVFGDKDAQFEMARLLIQPDASAENMKRGIHFLSVLSQEGHAGAQATLAEIFWSGKLVPKDQRRALALISVAVENAPNADRLWIEHIYQNIFCASSQRTRTEANPLIAGWKKIFQRKTDDETRMGLGKREPQLARACGNGEPVDIRRSAAPLNELNAGVPAPPGATSFAPPAGMAAREPVPQGPSR